MSHQPGGGDGRLRPAASSWSDFPPAGPLYNVHGLRTRISMATR